LYKHLFALTLLACLSLTAPAAASSPAVDLGGTWVGNYDIAHSGTDLLTLVLTKTETGYTGILNDSLGFVAKDTPITEVKVEGVNLGFSFVLIFETGEPADQRAELTLDGGKLIGRLEFSAKGAGAGVPFELVRKK